MDGPGRLPVFCRADSRPASRPASSGRKFGSIATGGAVGVLAWIFTSSLIVAGVAVLVGTVFALITSLGLLNRVGRRASGARQAVLAPDNRRRL
jgi:VIT1/CCC1 family predicted Fe2+/Mn2+ transporter